MLHTQNRSLASGSRPVRFSTCARRDHMRVLAQMQHYDVAVVGAGPAGLSAAAALQVATQSQKLIHVFEKTAMTARGAAILVGPNGLKALHAVDPALLEGMLAKATKLEGSDRYNMHTGEHMEYMAMRNEAFQEKYGFHNALLGWSDITGALKSALPQASISTGCPVTGYKQQDDGTIQLLGPAASSSASSDAEVIATCNILIGADGWFSPIRQQLLQDGPPSFKDAVVYRARIPRPDFMPEHRTKWWVPPTGPNSGAPLAVFIPLPGGDMVWQCHCPMSMMQEKGLAFDPVKGEAGSSHASNQQSSSSSAKERCLKGLSHFLQCSERWWKPHRSEPSQSMACTTHTRADTRRFLGRRKRNTGG
ncbi:hypothetical protein COO60DRAFT_1702741 [Scenedesmus sp. NREL 46B-D3]|nr:hypothetical protein COO60DRAFT_1702741 [Scenedesmus sp. NREL 46B-D3]